MEKYATYCSRKNCGPDGGGLANAQRGAAPSIDTEGLLREYATTGNTAIRDRVVEAHLYIASIIARRFSGRGVEYDDLFQVASLSLLKSIERFDPERGVKFASFVTPTMVGEVKNYFRDRSRLIRLPRRGSELVRALETAKDALQLELQRQPTAEELAERTARRLRMCLRRWKCAARSAPYPWIRCPRRTMKARL